MQEGLEGVQKQGTNRLNIEEVKDLDAVSLRELFTSSELVNDGDVISPEDYESIKRRAEVLLQNSSEPLSTNAALLAACVDRLKLKEKIGMEALKNMPVGSLKAIFYAETNILFTDEELDLFKTSPLSVEEWIGKRSEIRNEQH